MHTQELVTTTTVYLELEMYNKTIVALGAGSSTTQLNVYGASISVVPKSDENSTSNTDNVFYINRYKENKNIDMQSDEKEADRNSDLRAFIKNYDVPEDYISRCERAVSTAIQKAKEQNNDYFDQVDALVGLNMPQALVTGVLLDKGNDLPNVAPEKWPVRGKGYKLQPDDETPEQFAVRVYGQWMRPAEPHRSIGMPEILRLDGPLYHALRRSKGGEKPVGFFLPSKKEQGDALLQLRSEKILPNPLDYAERRRLEVLAYRRRKKEQQHI